ncbi:MAG: hypothetical protein K5656_00760 [Lachnospiraceae bacterium]|nr:hypothetical protein [Lachnospiraceae bacterium]
MDMIKKRRKIIGGGIFILLLVAAIFGSSKDAYAAKKVKLSKTSLTFASDKAKAQTVKVQNIKTSNIKSLTITNGNTVWFSAKKKGKNQIVVTPKRSSPKQTTSIMITVEFKKPIKGNYREYLNINNVRVKGSSNIAVKTAKQLCNLEKNCTSNRWTYYLANDIDMTGVDPIDYRYADLNIDGKGHKIISDRPVFDEYSGKIKNVEFVCNYNCVASDKDNPITKLISGTFSDDIAPISTLAVNASMIGCKSTGTISINIDSNIKDYIDIQVGGLVGRNDYVATIKQCKSEVNITVTQLNGVNIHNAYIAGIAWSNCNKSTIAECEFAGSIHTNYPWGSLAGITVTNDEAGIIYDCLNSGEIKLTSSVNGWPTGGIMNGGRGTVDRVLNVGNVDAGILGGQILDEDDEKNGQLPTLTNVYYWKSKSAAVQYRDSQKPFAISGVNGVEEAEQFNEATYVGFDFTNIWKMTDQGPKLKNVPA